MPGVTYALADFRTGGPIVDLPVKKGATWGAQLNRPDAVECSIDMRAPEALALDLRSSSEPNKTILFARTDSDHILAWGLIPDDGRRWDEDRRELTLSATGISSSWLGHTVIAPVDALTEELIIPDADGDLIPNPALDTTLSGWSLGTIGKKLVEQRLAFPGAPTVFDLPPDEPGTHERTYLFASLKMIGKALDDLADVENGPDFAFDAQRGSDGLSLRYVMRHGSEETPRLGTHVGVWNLRDLVGLTIVDADAAGASVGWMSAGKASGVPLLSRARNTAPIDNGYPPLDVVDTSHNDVSVLATLDAYNRQNVDDAQTTRRDLAFSVRADASPALGQYRSGDTVTIDVGSDHPWLSGFDVRITSISGDEQAKEVKIGCVILDVG